MSYVCSKKNMGRVMISNKIKELEARIIDLEHALDKCVEVIKILGERIVEIRKHLER